MKYIYSRRRDIMCENKWYWEAIDSWGGNEGVL